jgi:hypothetical protein
VKVHFNNLFSTPANPDQNVPGIAFISIIASVRFSRVAAKRFRPASDK